MYVFMTFQNDKSDYDFFFFPEVRNLRSYVDTETGQNHLCNPASNCVSKKK